MKPDNFFSDDFELPKTRCKLIERKDCKTCGRFIGFIEPRNQNEYPRLYKQIQDRHDKIRQKEFDSLKLVPIKD